MGLYEQLVYGRANQTGGIETKTRAVLWGTKLVTKNVFSGAGISPRALSQDTDSNKWSFSGARKKTALSQDTDSNKWSFSRARNNSKQEAFCRTQTVTNGPAAGHGITVSKRPFAGHGQ
jgi:hypothetical protein